MTQPHLPISDERAVESILETIAAPRWEPPSIVHHSADDMDRGSLRILAGETPIDQKPGDGGDGDDAPY